MGIPELLATARLEVVPRFARPELNVAEFKIVEEIADASPGADEPIADV